MDCNEARALVTAYVDGEVGVVEARSVEAHIGSCTACREERDLQRELKSAIATKATYFRAPEGLAQRIAAAIARDATVSSTAAAQVGVIDTAPSASNVARSPAVRVEPVAARPRVPGDATGASSAPPGASSPVVRPAHTAGTARAARAAPWWRSPALVGFALAASLMAVAWTGGIYLSLPSSSERLGSELVASHVRSLMSGHGIDVVSSDQHTVKPWFNGRIDYAPPVHDFAEQGFPLVGGRLDYVDHRQVATLVYKRRLHTVDVYVWPATAGSDDVIARLTDDGHHVLGWRNRGMQFWAVSDTEASDLDALRAAIDAQS